MMPLVTSRTLCYITRLGALHLQQRSLKEIVEKQAYSALFSRTLYK
jgi:hypothetical protein